jgi:archaetidylinositol phosphate synthase
MQVSGCVPGNDSRCDKEPSMADLKPHSRVNDILLGPLERPALHWLAAHMPAWVTPDILTLIGLGGSVLIFASYALTNVHPAFLWLASLGFAVNWFGDSLDGTLARYRRIERPRYGFFVDHSIDAFSELLVVLGLGLTPFIRFDVAAVALIAYLLVSVLVYVRTYVEGVFQISYGKLGPTEVRLILILINVFLFFFENPAIDLGLIRTTVFDLVVGALAVILFAIFISTTVRVAREMAAKGE